MPLSPNEQNRIEAAVIAAERRTSAEFALVVADAADDYDAYPILWAALLALVTGGALAVLAPGLGLKLAFAAQAMVFLVTGLLLHLPVLRPFLAPASVRRDEAAKLARLQFAALVQERTQGSAGLLLFVSLAEHHVEILPDRAIAERIPEQAWREIVDGFVAQMRAGQLADGFVTAVERCTAILESHFPVEPGDRDELSNRVTLI
jgi:putative membrane protein